MPLLPQSRGLVLVLASALAVVLVLVLELLEAAYGVVAWTVQHTQPQPHKHTRTVRV